jgi:hypothetical protein
MALGARRSPFTVHRSPFTVRRSPFAVRRLAFGVWRLALTRSAALFAARCFAARGWVGFSLDAVGKCLPARPGGTIPIVAWHEVPGKGSLERTVP